MILIKVNLMILIKVNLTFITIRYDCCIDVNIRLGSDRPPRATG